MSIRDKILPTFILATAVGMTAYAAGTVTSSTAISGGGPSGAHGWHHGRGHGPEGSYFGLLHQLNLTSDQRTKIKAVFAQAKPQFEALRTTQRATHDRLAGTLPTDPAYAALLASAQNGAQSEETLRAQTWGLVLQELTPAQLAQIPGLLSAREEAWAARKAAWQAQHPVPVAQ